MEKTNDKKNKWVLVVAALFIVFIASLCYGNYILYYIEKPVFRIVQQSEKDGLTLEDYKQSPPEMRKQELNLMIAEDYQYMVFGKSDIHGFGRYQECWELKTNGDFFHIEGLRRFDNDFHGKSYIAVPKYMNRIHLDAKEMQELLSKLDSVYVEESVSSISLGGFLLKLYDTRAKEDIVISCPSNLIDYKEVNPLVNFFYLIKNLFDQV